MDFSFVMNEIMPEVNIGSDTPILIYRNKIGDWYAHDVINENGGTYDIVKDAKDDDPYAITVKGSDFAKGSFPYVYDKILTARLRAEYDTLQYERFIEGEIDSDEFKKLKIECTEQLNKLNNRLTLYKQTRRDRLANEKVTVLAKDAIQETASPRDIVNALIEKVYVFPDDRIEIKWKFVNFAAGI